MIHVHFDPVQLPQGKKVEWDSWIERANTATNEMIGAWESSRDNPLGAKFEAPFKAAIWSDLKDWLLKNVFHNKCAYCETHIGRSQFHADHYRPKARVRFKVGGQKKLRTAICSDPSGQAMEHPGYFWLAYDWWNLLPSCALCNTVQGKKDQFPIRATANAHILLRSLTPGDLDELVETPISSRKWSGFYYLRSRDLNPLEDPLLLHPYADDDPKDHLMFGDKGVIAARAGSEKGQQSINVYNLDNKELDALRQEAQEKAENQFLIAYIHHQHRAADIQTKIELAETSLSNFHAGREPYSAAALDYVKLLRSEFGR